ncbi:MAG: 30S ribosomal protein S17 [Pseudomonadota bacterium]|nr:30S ribosomal protein S17 [Pseudomonadota bacterium]
MSGIEKKARSVNGTVISCKTEKTILVLVERRIKHPLYRKFVRKSSKIMAHDEKSVCAEGDIVSIEECRPISKNKSWTLKELIKQSEKI